MAVKSYSVLINNKISEFNKVINVDPDKSISIRAFLIGSISQGVSKISDALLSEDVFSTINCLRKLNCKIIKKSKNKYEVFGKGLGSYYAKKNTLLNLGMSNLKNIRQGKHFEIEVDENDETMAKKKIDIMCKKLLVNLIIEDYKINKI